MLPPEIRSTRQQCRPVLCLWLSCIFLSCRRSAGFLCIYILGMSVLFQLLGFIVIIMRPSSLGGAAYCVALCLSVRPSRYCFCLLYSRTVLRANIQNRKTSVFAYGPASRMYFSARAEGRISYGHLGRTSLLYSFFTLAPMFFFLNRRYRNL